MHYRFIGGEVRRRGEYAFKITDSLTYLKDVVLHEVV